MICFDKDMSGPSNKLTISHIGHSSNSSIHSNPLHGNSHETVSDNDDGSNFSIVIKTVPLRKIPSFPKHQQESTLKLRNSMRISSERDSDFSRESFVERSSNRFGVSRLSYHRQGSIKFHSKLGQHYPEKASRKDFLPSHDLISLNEVPNFESNIFSSSSSTYSANDNTLNHSSSIYDRPYASPMPDNKAYFRSNSMESTEERHFNPYIENQRNRLSLVLEEPVSTPTMEREESTIQDKESQIKTESHRRRSASVQYRRRVSSFKPTCTYIRRNNEPKVVESQKSSKRHKSIGSRRRNAAPQLKRSNAIKRKIGWLSAHIKEFLQKLKERLHFNWRVIRHKKGVKFRSSKPRNQRGTVSSMYANKPKSLLEEASLKSFNRLPEAQKHTLPDENSILLAPCQMTNDMNINAPQDMVQLTRDRTIAFRSYSNINPSNSQAVKDTYTEEENNRRKELTKMLPLWDHYIKVAISKRIQMNIDLHNAELKRKNTGSTMAKQDFLSRYISPDTISSDMVDTESTNSSDSEDYLSMYSHSSIFGEESISDAASIPSAVSIPESRQEYNKLCANFEGTKMTNGFISLPPTRKNSTAINHQSKIVRSKSMFFSATRDNNERCQNNRLSLNHLSPSCLSIQNTSLKGEFSFERMDHPVCYSRNTTLY